MERTLLDAPFFNRIDMEPVLLFNPKSKLYHLIMKLFVFDVATMPTIHVAWNQKTPKHPNVPEYSLALHRREVTIELATFQTFPLQFRLDRRDGSLYEPYLLQDPQAQHLGNLDTFYLIDLTKPASPKWKVGR